MSDLATPNPEIAPAVGVGGLLSVKAEWPWYVPLLSGPDSSGLSHAEKFLPIPGKGLAPFDEMYGELSEQVTQLHERLERRMVIFGHSLGGLMVTRLGLEHPDKISDVVCLAGVQEGIKGETKAATLLRLAVGNPPHASMLYHDSDFMQTHIKQVRDEWPAGTSLHLISPTHDYLIPSPQGLGLELPTGQSPSKRFVTPKWFNMARNMPDDAEPLYGLPVSHVTIARSAPVIHYVQQLRGAEEPFPVEAPPALAPVYLPA